MADWKIQKSAVACASCRTKFEVGARFYSVLFDRPDGYVREDRCEACFAAQRPEGFFSFWRTTMQAPDTPKRPVFDLDALLDFFRNLKDANDPASARFRYFLALMLMRKRRLKVQAIERQDGREIMVLVEPKTQEEHEVESLSLSDAEIMEVRDKLGEWMGLPPETSPDPGPPAAQPAEAAAEGQGEAADQGEAAAPAGSEPAEPGAEGPGAESAEAVEPEAEAPAEGAPSGSRS